MFTTKTKANPHPDYFGSPVNVGDIVLGASPKKNHYQDTAYRFSVVISKTKGMVRLHQLGDSKEILGFPKDKILEDVRRRNGRRGGAINPCNLINTGVNTGLTEKEFTEVNKRVDISSLVHSMPLFP